MNIGNRGRSGEDRVASFLRKRGFGIIKRNYQCRYGEIDIIAEKDEYIVFVEVKTRKKNAEISGAEAVDHNKQRKIMLTARDYITKSGTALSPRFDVAEVTVEETEEGGQRFRLNYIENAMT